MTHLEKAIEFVRQNVSDEEIAHSWGLLDRYRCPLEIINRDFYNKICDLMEEYGEDQGLPEGWWLEYTDDAEEIFMKL